MDKLEISFHPLFFVFAFVLIYFGWAGAFVTYLLVLVMHEYVHYFVAFKLGYKLDKILFMPYGLKLNGKISLINSKHELLIALSGPLFNIILFMIVVVVWWCFPDTYNYTYTFAFANLSLGLTNLIPLFPLDGGRVLVALMSPKLNRGRIIKCMKVCGFVLGSIFAILFVLSAWNSVNLTYFTISMFLISGVFVGDNDRYYDKISVTSKTGILPTKHYTIIGDANVYNLVKYISGNSYVIFDIVKDGKLVASITEKQVIDKFNSTHLFK